MQIIILAAGKGSRMKSDLPKVMHKVAGKSMLEHVVDNCSKVTQDLVLVYSDHIEPYLYLFQDKCKLVKQEEQLGTAHAVYVAKALFNQQDPIGVIYGDNPLISADIIFDLFDHLNSSESKAVTLAFDYDQPNQYGRIITDENGNFQSIVEAKFATDTEKKITLCNSGIMAFAPGILDKYIDLCVVPNVSNPERELYLTDIIAICNQHQEKVTYYRLPEHHRVVGVNTQEELLNANELIKKI